MAMITCPQCGKMISDQAQQCVHCGCKLTACPDCGALVEDGANFCGKCGRPLSSEQAQETDKTSQPDVMSADSYKKIAILKKAFLSRNRAGTNEKILSFGGLILLFLGSGFHISYSTIGKPIIPTIC